MITAKLGDRFYDFDCYSDAENARNMFETFSGSQLEFEDCMEYAGIDFLYSFDFDN